MFTDAYGGVGGRVKNSKMLTDAYGEVGGWCENLVCLQIPIMGIFQHKKLLMGVHCIKLLSKF